MSVLQLKWIKAIDGTWLELNTFPNLSEQTTEGVYVIWHGGKTPRTVYVGQGKICDRLASHRGNDEIQEYADQGLYVTWAAVSAAQRNGVERHLADTLNPLVGEAHPNAVPIAVNSPWS